MVGTTAEIGKFAFSISPHNELKNFKQQLSDFLNSTHEKFRFEPYDPSFELIIERTQETDDFKVYFWVDAGNTSGLEYSWDSLGLRFITNISELKNIRFT